MNAFKVCAMSKITYEQKMELIQRYKMRPMAVGDPDVFTAIQADVVKAYSNGTRRGTVQGSEQPKTSAIYNQCMGVYREFLQRIGLQFNVSGKKARDYREAMENI